jgi:DNA polymerase epsilon subunit 2
MDPPLAARTPFRRLPPTSTDIPSSSPGFGTPVHPFIPPKLKQQPQNPTILPVLLPAATLRPLAFRTFTKKHSLTLTSPALQALASFIGKKCGAGWREEGLAEKVLEEIARAWKKNGGGVIVDDGDMLSNLLKQLDSFISGGHIVQGGLSRAASFSFKSDKGLASEPPLLRTDSVGSAGVGELDINEDDLSKDIRKWATVISAFDQPRLTYNSSRKHFEKYGSDKWYLIVRSWPEM